MIIILGCGYERSGSIAKKDIWRVRHGWIRRYKRWNGWDEILDWIYEWVNE
jgi:hypothetical protein